MSSDNNDRDFAAQHSSRIFTWAFTTFYNMFVKPHNYDHEGYKNHRPNLKEQEDLKAIVWAYGGPRPSLIKSVELTVIPERAVVQLHWEDKDAIREVVQDSQSESHGDGSSILPELQTVDSVSSASCGIDSQVQECNSDGVAL